MLIPEIVTLKKLVPILEDFKEEFGVDWMLGGSTARYFYSKNPPSPDVDIFVDLFYDDIEFKYLLKKIANHFKSTKPVFSPIQHSLDIQTGVKIDVVSAKNFLTDINFWSEAIKNAYKINFYGYKISVMRPEYSIVSQLNAISNLIEAFYLFRINLKTEKVKGKARELLHKRFNAIYSLTKKCKIDKKLLNNLLKKYELMYSPDVLDFLKGEGIL